MNDINYSNNSRLRKRVRMIRSVHLLVSLQGRSKLDNGSGRGRGEGAHFNTFVFRDHKKQSILIYYITPN